jgi:rubrerythrin
MGLKFWKKKKENTVVNTASDVKTIVNENGNVEIVSKNFTITTNSTSKLASPMPGSEPEGDTWTCWGCGHSNTGDTCTVCGKKKYNNSKM